MGLVRAMPSGVDELGWCPGLHLSSPLNGFSLHDTTSHQFMGTWGGFGGSWFRWMCGMVCGVCVAVWVCGECGCGFCIMKKGEVFGVVHKGTIR